MLLLTGSQTQTVSCCQIAPYHILLVVRACYSDCRPADRRRIDLCLDTSWSRHLSPPTASFPLKGTAEHHTAISSRFAYLYTTCLIRSSLRLGRSALASFDRLPTDRKWCFIVSISRFQRLPPRSRTTPRITTSRQVCRSLLGYTAAPNGQIQGSVTRCIRE